MQQCRWLWHSLFQPNSVASTDQEVSQEFRSHLALLQDHYESLGHPPGEARRLANEEFGDFEELLATCRTVRIGDRTMLQRANVVALGVFCALTVSMGWAAFQWKGEATERISGMASQLEQISDKLDEPRLANSPITAYNPGTLLPGNDSQANGGAGSPELLIATVNASHDPDVAFLVGKRIAALPPREALDVIREVYPAINSPQDRKRVLKPFVAKRDHDHIVKVLHLAATDPDSRVRQAGFERLKDYAFRDFAGTHTAYLDWYQQFGDQDLRSLLKGSFAAEVRRLTSLDATEFDKALADWEGIDLGLVEGQRIDMASIAKKGGLLARLEQWHAMSDIQTQKRALDVLGRFGLGQDYLKDTIVKRLAGWLNSSNAQLQERSRELISYLVESGARRAIPSAAWDLLVRGGRHGKDRRPLDLPSGGKGKREMEDEEAPETIELFGTLMEGDAFFFFLLPRLPTNVTNPDYEGSTSYEVIKSEIARAITQLSSRGQFGVVAWGGPIHGPDLVELAPQIWKATPRRATRGWKQAAVLWIEGLEDVGTYSIYALFLDAMKATIEIANKSKLRKRTLVFAANYLPVTLGSAGDEPNSVFDTEYYLEAVRAANTSDLQINTILVQFGAFQNFRTKAAEFWSDLANENRGTYTEIQHD